MITFRINNDFYVNAREVIQGNEGFAVDVYSDSSGLPTIGYGYALIAKGKDPSTGAVTFDINSKITDDFAAIGVTWGEAEKVKLENIRKDLAAGNIAAASTKTEELDALVRDITEPEAQKLYNRVFDRKMGELYNKLALVLGATDGLALWTALGGSTKDDNGKTVPIIVAGTTELIALVVAWAAGRIKSTTPRASWAR